MSTNKLLDIRTYLDAADTHGEDSGADYQIGDLEIMLRTMHSLLTPAQKRAFALHDKVQDVMEGTGLDVSEEQASLQSAVEAEKASALGLVDAVCAQSEGNGIFSVGATAALQAMRYHWADHLAEGHPNAVILQDIDGLTEQIGNMKLDLSRALANKPA